MESLQQALEIQRTIGDQNGVAESMLAIASIERDRGNLEEARKSIESALATIESLRGRIASPTLRSTYRALKENQYALYVDVLMRLNLVEDALIANEQSRARSLREMLAESRVDITEGIDPD